METEIKRNARGSRIFVTEPDPKNLHIIHINKYDNNDRKIGSYWIVSREGQRELLATFNTQKVAINETIKNKKDDETIIVHNKEGQLDRYIQ